MPGYEIQTAGGAPPGQVSWDAPQSLLDNVGAAVCQVLGIASLSHRAALVDLCRRAAIPAGAVRAAYEVIADNWRRCHQITAGGTSRQNWRWRRPQLAIGAGNPSPEVGLERALIAGLERAGRTDWANQVPVASGIAGSSRERRRAIDLVHEVTPGYFELIELKVGSDTPLYAAFEIIAYTCIWLVSRSSPTSDASLILEASRLDAVVWAPVGFYEQRDLSLQRQLAAELAALGSEHDVDLTFRFDTYAEELAPAPFGDERVLALLRSRRPL